MKEIFRFINDRLTKGKLISEDFFMMSSYCNIISKYLVSISSSLKDFQNCYIALGKIIRHNLDFMKEKEELNGTEKLFLVKGLFPLISFFFSNFLETKSISFNPKFIEITPILYSYTKNTLKKCFTFEKVDNEAYSLVKEFGRKLNIEEESDIEMDLLKERKNSLIRRSISAIHDVAKNNQSTLEENAENLWYNFQKWIKFKSFVFTDPIKDTEIYSFSNSIESITNLFNQESITKENQYFLVSSRDIFEKIFSFLNNWRRFKVNKDNVKFLLNNITILLERKNEPLNRKETQDLLCKLGGHSMLIKLILEEKEYDPEYFATLFKFGTLLIKGIKNENKESQIAFYNLFLKDDRSTELFFKKIYFTLQEGSKDNIEDEKKRAYLLINLLKFLQILCEGHFEPLQNMLRIQTNSKTSYNIVIQTAVLLSETKLSKITISISEQCLNTLAEFMQGPCKGNQKAVLGSKFLEYSGFLLNEDSRIFIHSSSQDKLRLSLIAYIESNKQSSDLEINPFFEISDLVFSNEKSSHIASIKYRCLTTIFALIECFDSSDKTILRIARSLPSSTFIEHICKIYKFLEENQKGVYNIESFKENGIFILESAFLAFFLIRIYLNHPEQKTKGFIDPSDLNEINSAFALSENSQKKSFFMEISMMFTELISSYVMKLITYIKTLGSKENQELLTFQKNLEKRKLRKRALSFLYTNHGQIEVLREDELHTIYFPLLPECKRLPKSEKNHFHEKVNRVSTNSKLTDLMAESDYFLRVMKHEENLDQLFSKSKLLSLIASNGILWENFAFLTNLIINALILFSYSSYSGSDFENDPIGKEDYRLKATKLFFQDSNEIMTTNLFIAMGALNLFFSSLVVSFIVIKRAPILAGKIWIDYFNFLKSNALSKPIVIFIKLGKAVFLTFTKFLGDFDFVFYITYMLFAILGLVIHYFFFSFHLLDFLRIQHLKNVVKAIIIPRKQLLLTLLLFFVIQYYVALIGFTFFADNYRKQGSLDFWRCESMWICFLSTFDLTFKQNGGVGSSLFDPLLENLNVKSYMTDQFPKYISRFIFDNVANIIVVFILINMIAGIIIDTFGALKDALHERELDQKQLCFICGIEREVFEKNSENKKGFLGHIKNEHYLWDYIFYKAYLFSKKSTELTGNEQTILELIRENNISWIPIKRTSYLKSDGSKIQQKKDLMKVVERNMMEISQKLEIVNKKYK